MIGNKIREIRNSLGMTQQQFSEFTGITRSAISEYENNTKDIGLKTLTKIAKATNKKLSYFLDEDTDTITISFSKKEIDLMEKIVDIAEMFKNKIK